MKKNFTAWIFTALTFMGQSLFAQSPSSLIESGNQAYNQKNFSAAENDYRKAISADAQHAYPQAIFNLGNALFMQKKYDEAARQFEQFGTRPKSSLTSAAYFNLGNCLLAEKKYGESAEAYRKCLLLDEKDNDARYNLSLALAYTNPSANSVSENINTPQQMNTPEEPPLSEDEMKNLLNQLSQQERQTLDSMKRRTYSRKAKKDW